MLILLLSLCNVCMWAVFPMCSKYLRNVRNTSHIHTCKYINVKIDLIKELTLSWQDRKFDTVTILTSSGYDPELLQMPHLLTTYLTEIHLNVILPSPWSFKWTFSKRISVNILSIPLLPHPSLISVHCNLPHSTLLKHYVTCKKNERKE
jgi:hypothetical protein